MLNGFFLHGNEYVQELKERATNLLLLLLVLDEQPRAGNIIHDQKMIFLLQKSLNNQKFKNFSYTFYKTNPGLPHSDELSNDIRLLISSGLLLKKKIDVVISSYGKQLVSELVSLLKNSNGFVQHFMEEVERIGMMSERGLRLLIDGVKVKRGTRIYRKLNSLEDKTVIQKKYEYRKADGLMLSVNDIATLLNLFNENLRTMIRRSLNEMYKGVAPRSVFSGRYDLKATRHCIESIYSVTKEQNIDDNEINIVFNHLSRNPGKYKIDLDLAFKGLCSVLIGNLYVLTFVPCIDCPEKRLYSDFAKNQIEMRKALKDKAIVMVGFEKVL